MANKLQILIGSIKDKASIITTANSPFDAAVLKATPHHPSSLPPSPHHLSALLSFGTSSRLSATALIRSLTSRLSKTSNPSVALKCLLSLHHILLHASFILIDAAVFILVPKSGHRSVLNLSSFKNPNSISLSIFVRWYARVLELLVSTKKWNDEEYSCERLASLLNVELINEVDALVGVVLEMNRVPDVEVYGDNKLVMEITRTIGEERENIEEGIRVRVREVKERLAELAFVDCVELVCLLRKIEKCKWVRMDGCDLFWRDVRKIKECAERREEKEIRGRVRIGVGAGDRKVISESARIDALDRIIGDQSLIFCSNRFV